jgi:hypothetical protein
LNFEHRNLGYKWNRHHKREKSQESRIKSLEILAPLGKGAP